MERLPILLLSCVLTIGCSDSGGDLPPPPRPSNLGVLDGEVRTAVEAQLELVATSPGDLQARAQLARLYQANGLPSESVSAWQQILEVDPSNPKYWYLLALAHHEQGDSEAALAAAERCRSLDSRILASWWRPAFWELDMGRPAAAEPLARKAIELAPQNAGGYVALARTLLAIDQAGEAIQVLNQLRGQSSHPYVLYLLGQAHQRAGHAEQAEAYFANGKAKQPDYPDPWHVEILDAQRGLDATISRIDRLLEAGQVNEAAAAIAKGQKTWPSNVNLLHRRSDLFRQRGDTKRWILELKNALKLEPDNAATHLNLSIAYLQDNNRSLAMNHAIAAAKANPLLPQAHLQQARLHLLNNEMPRAVPSLDEAFRLGVQDPRERLQYAHVLLRVGRFEEAERNALQVTTVDPRNPLAWGVLAETRHAQGRMREAMEALRSGIEVDPGNEALLMLQQRFRQPPSTNRATP